MVRVKKNLTLEDYISFLNNPTHYDNITIKHLKQIIYMHGFKKIHNQPKKDLLDALSSIQMLVPTRSTIKEKKKTCYYSSSAALSKKEVIRDIDELDWKECALQSIQTLTTTNTTTTQDGNDDEVEEYPTTTMKGNAHLKLDDGCKKNTVKKRRRRKKKNIVDIGTWGAKRTRYSTPSGGDAANAANGGGGSGSGSGGGAFPCSSGQRL